MPLLPLLTLVLLSAPVQEVAKERGFDAIALPLVSYNSDLGLGLGAVGGMYLYAPGYRPYRHGIALQAFITTRGVQNHWIRYDGPNLFSGLRFELRAEFR